MQQHLEKEAIETREETESLGITTTMSLERCLFEFQAATTCVKSTVECKECYNPNTFESLFPDELESVFRETLTVNPPSQENACPLADAMLCQYYNSDAMDCCCQEETYKFMACAFEEIYQEKYALFYPCEFQCLEPVIEEENPCDVELQRSRTCVQMDVRCAACLSAENFLEDFPTFVDTEFRKALASVSSPTVEGFCDDAHSRLCDYHQEDLVRTVCRVDL